ncbi:MAG: hypothetical protein ACTSXD_08705 [Candidatus Heimdallarchaeaceae archaeon]
MTTELEIENQRKLDQKWNDPKNWHFLYDPNDGSKLRLPLNVDISRYCAKGFLMNKPSPELIEFNSKILAKKKREKMKKQIIDEMLQKEAEKQLEKELKAEIKADKEAAIREAKEEIAKTKKEKEEKITKPKKAKKQEK